MKQITVENIYDCLMTMKHEVKIDEDTRVKAKNAIDAMLALPKMETPPDFKTGLAPVDLHVESREALTEPAE
jgi:quinolinate synthase